MFHTPDVLVVGETTPIWRNPTERLLPSKLVGAVLTTSKTTKHVFGKDDLRHEKQTKV